MTKFTGPGISKPEGITAGPDRALWFTTVLRCSMQGVVDPLVKALSRYQVVDLNSREADLEDTFLALYGEEAAK